MKKEDLNKPGYIWIPYIFVTVSTCINGETVWYRNKFKNFLLKIKYFFIKPKYFSNIEVCRNEKINPANYTTINEIMK